MVDTNVVLDVLPARKRYVRPAAEIVGLIERSRIEAFLCATTITTLDYLLGQALTRKKSRDALHRLTEIFEIAAVNRSVIEEALTSEGRFRGCSSGAGSPSGGGRGHHYQKHKKLPQGINQSPDPVEFLATLGE